MDLGGCCASKDSCFVVLGKDGLSRLVILKCPPMFDGLFVVVSCMGGYGSRDSVEELEQVTNPMKKLFQSTGPKNQGPSWTVQHGVRKVHNLINYPKHYHNKRKQSRDGAQAGTIRFQGKQTHQRTEYATHLARPVKHHQQRSNQPMFGVKMT